LPGIGQDEALLGYYDYGLLGVFKEGIRIIGPEIKDNRFYLRDKIKLF